MSVANQNASIEDDLEEILKKLRNHEKEAINLVKYLEGNSYDRNVHDLEFCKSYTIKLIQTYCKDSEDKNGNILKSEDKCELMLAACGLLATIKFEGTTQAFRVKLYYDYAKEYSSLLTPGWSATSIDTTVRRILNDIKAELIEELEDERAKNGGRLNFIMQVPDKLCLPPLRDNQAPSRPKEGVTPSRYIISDDTLKIIYAVAWVVIAVSLMVIAIVFVIHVRSKDAPPTRHQPYYSELNDIDALDVKNSVQHLFIGEEKHWLELSIRW